MWPRKPARSWWAWWARPSCSTARTRTSRSRSSCRPPAPASPAPPGAAAGASASAAPQPLPQAHAHNDYLHPRPLRDALDHGFCSVEADIFLVDGKLLVAHERREVRPQRTLEALYLDPLLARARKNAGRIYPGGLPFTLLVDIKSDAEPTYRALAKVLAWYAEMLTRYREGAATPGAVTAVLSGNRPRKLLEEEKLRYAAMDGRLEDLGAGAPPSLIPLVSSNWTMSFAWRGVGPFPAAEREKLKSLVRRAHDAGYRLRFWATPDLPEAWRELRAAEVDLINTDNLPGLAAFLLRAAGE
ncbi:MAG: phosphatidylinositol-specific phospholipase C/glycerophosphodiester phosphodiesterase family protein [Actinomycetota bacterium]